jgi:hypothetical protein
MEQEQFRFEQWLADGAKGIRSQLMKTRFLPEAFWEHSWAAGRESLLAVRSLLDAAIEKTEKKPAKRVTKIKVEKGD